MQRDAPLLQLLQDCTLSKLGAAIPEAQETHLMCYRCENVDRVPQHASLLSLAVENLFLLQHRPIGGYLGGKQLAQENHIRRREGGRGKGGVKETWLIPEPSLLTVGRLGEKKRL